MRFPVFRWLCSYIYFYSFVLFVNLWNILMIIFSRSLIRLKITKKLMDKKMLAWSMNILITQRKVSPVKFVNIRDSLFHHFKLNRPNESSLNIIYRISMDNCQCWWLATIKTLALFAWLCTSTVSNTTHWYCYQMQFYKYISIDVYNFI